MNRPPLRYFIRWLMALSLTLLLIAASLLVIRNVYADAAPPPGAAASDVAPGQGTQVQMISETIVFDIRSEPLVESNYTHTVAWVTANFVMRNLGSQTEMMDVRFPMAWPTKWGPPGHTIEKVTVTVADRPVTTKQVDFAGQPWVIWPATFPPGEDVRLQVSYQTAATEWGNSLLGYFSAQHPYGNNSLAEFYYVLETGAGWRGPSGRATSSFSFLIQPAWK